MSIYTMKIVGEKNDTAPVIDKHNIVIKTKYNGFKMMDDASFTDWEKIFVFPDNKKALYFKDNFKDGMRDFRQGMLKDNYIFHIINCRYPEPEEVYANQLRMSSDVEY